MDTLEQHINITLRHLHGQVNEIKKLQQHLDNLIEPELGRFIRVSNLKNQTLILMADNASVATHIKLIAPELVKILKEKAKEFNITEIKCKIKKAMESPNLPKQQTNTISRESARAISETADGISNPRLQAALKKLGSINPKQITS